MTVHLSVNRPSNMELPPGSHKVTKVISPPLGELEFRGLNINDPKVQADYGYTDEQVQKYQAHKRSITTGISN